jgi:hypothetical protein
MNCEDCNIKLTVVNESLENTKVCNTCHDENSACGCGGTMHWCSICEMYSMSCCIDYGTCMCS